MYTFSKYYLDPLPRFFSMFRASLHSALHQNVAVKASMGRKVDPVFAFIALVALTSAFVSHHGAAAVKFVEQVEASIVLGNATVNITSVQKCMFSHHCKLYFPLSFHSDAIFRTIFNCRLSILLSNLFSLHNSSRFVLFQRLQ